MDVATTMVSALIGPIYKPMFHVGDSRSVDATEGS